MKIPYGNHLCATTVYSNGTLLVVGAESEMEIKVAIDQIKRLAEPFKRKNVIDSTKHANNEHDVTLSL